MKFIDTSYFFEVDEAGSEQRFRLFSLEKGEKDGEESPDDRFEGVALASKDPAHLCETLRLGGSVNAPEFRMVSLRHTYERQGVLVSIKSPVSQRRTYKKILYATFCVPAQTDERSLDHLRSAMRGVLKGSVLVAAIRTPSNALPGFMDLVSAELNRRNVQIEGLRLGLYTEKDA